MTRKEYVDRYNAIWEKMTMMEKKYMLQTALDGTMNQLLQLATAGNVVPVTPSMEGALLEMEHNVAQREKETQADDPNN